MSIDIDKNKTHILQVYNYVLDDKSPTDWALFGYEGQTNVLKVVGYGDEGVEELAEDLNASKIMYGVIRIQDPKTSRTKIILLNWQGESAPNLRKGICARHLPDVKRMLKGVHITLTARTEEDVDTESILDALSKATSTEYNFKDRSEIPEKNVPVKNLVKRFWSGDVCEAAGTNYKRTNPQSEIDANRRNKFWEEQEAEEKVRKEHEIQKRDEEGKRLERERLEREVRDSKHREELNKERNARIFADKRAEMSAIENTKRLSGSPVWKKEDENQRREEEEVERARRADMMRMERKKEAESLIGHKTHHARSVFESQSASSSSSTSAAWSHSSTKFESNQEFSRPSRKLKEFNPNNEEISSSSQRENSLPKKSVGSRWPPPSDENVPEQRKTVPGKITDWKPQTPVDVSQHENHQINSFQKQASSGAELSFTGRSPIQQNNASQRATEVDVVDHTQPYHHPLSTSSLSTLHQSSSSSSSYTTVTSSTSPVSVASLSHSVEVPPPSLAELSPPPAFSKSPPTTSPQSAGLPSESSRERSTSSAYGRFSPSDTDIKDVNSHRTNGSMTQYEPEEELRAPYRTEEEEDEEVDELGPVCMTYEVDGIEYQILPEHGICARALYDYQAADDTEITFDPGDIITNIDQIDVGWWQGVSPMGVFGLFPANYVELINGMKIH